MTGPEAKRATARGNAPCGYRWPGPCAVVSPAARRRRGWHACTLPAGHSSPHSCGRCERAGRPATREVGPAKARKCATPIAETARLAAVPPPPDRSDASFEAFLDAQRQRIARHPGLRGGTWGGAGRGIKRGAQ